LQYVGEFASPGDPEYAPPVTRGETKPEKKARISAARKVAHDDVLAKAVAAWDPQATVGATEDPYKTLFVAKINYDTPEVCQPSAALFGEEGGSVVYGVCALWLDGWRCVGVLRSSRSITAALCSHRHHRVARLSVCSRGPTTYKNRQARTMANRTGDA
jgi:hypothetical protein